MLNEKHDEAHLKLNGNLKAKFLKHIK